MIRRNALCQSVAVGEQREPALMRAARGIDQLGRGDDVVKDPESYGVAA